MVETSAMTQSARYYDLRQAFGQAADGYIDGRLWELVNNPELRKELSRTRGYYPRPRGK
jgi:hypothetical protein